MSLVKPKRCENCGHGSKAKDSWLTCGVDEASPVRVVWTYACEKWVQEGEANKK